MSQKYLTDTIVTVTHTQQASKRQRGKERQRERVREGECDKSALRPCLLFVEAASVIAAAR